MRDHPQIMPDWSGLAQSSFAMRHCRSMDTRGTLLRLAAFTTDPGGGNPAGVWIGDAMPTDEEMQRIAAEVGYSESAFVAPDGSGQPGRLRVRYFSPLAEVPFCGHATIATGVALAERGFAVRADAAADDGVGRLVLETNGGPVTVDVGPDAEGHIRATLTSVATWVREPEPWLLDGAMATPRVACGRARHGAATGGRASQARST